MEECKLLVTNNFTKSTMEYIDFQVELIQG